MTVSQHPEIDTGVGSGAGSTRAPARVRGLTAVRSAAYRMVREPLTGLSVIVVAVLILWAILPGAFTGYSPLDGDLAHSLQAPSAAHLFGTDALGRDVWARVVYGAGLSLSSAGIAVGLAVFIGSTIGLASGYIGGRVDGAVMRVIDSMMAFPALLLAMLIITVLGFGSLQLGAAVGVSLIGVVSRLMRSEVLRVRTFAYVDAARTGGYGAVRIIFRHILPNAVGPVLALATLQVAQVILAIASLSFLGFGAPPPAPEWGGMVADGQRYLVSSWWISTFPGAMVAVLVLAIYQLSRRRSGSRAGGVA